MAGGRSLCQAVRGSFPGMHRRLAAIFAAMLLGAGVTGAPAAETREATVAGTLASSSGPRAASLRVICNPDPRGGALSLELRVPEAATRKDLDYDDFEGPDAVAAGAERTDLTVTAGGATRSLRRPAAGWYAGDDAAAFVFGVTELARRRGTLAALVARVVGEHAEIAWAQGSFDDIRRTLRARFELDAGAVGRFAAAARACVAAERPASRRGR